MGYSAWRFPRAGLDADRFGLRGSAVNPKKAGEESRRSEDLTGGMGTFYLPPPLASFYSAGVIHGAAHHPALSFSLLVQ